LAPFFCLVWPPGDKAPDKDRITGADITTTATLAGEVTIRANMETIARAMEETKARWSGE